MPRVRVPKASQCEGTVESVSSQTAENFEYFKSTTLTSSERSFCAAGLTSAWHQPPGSGKTQGLGLTFTARKCKLPCVVLSDLTYPTMLSA